MKAAVREQIESRINSMPNFPALPAVLAPLMEALQLPPADVDVGRIVDLVSRDESVAAQCIRVTNSAMFGRHRPVESIRDAVVALGLWRVSDIVFSCAVPQVFSSMQGVVDTSVFWRHTLCCAMVSQRMAKRIRSQSVEKAYLAGLLHDMGILVNATIFPQEFQETLKIAVATHVSLDEAEREVLGFTHAESGRILADLWRFSPDISTVLEFHHNVAEATSARDLVAIVHLADLVCRDQGMGYGFSESRLIDFSCSPAWLVLLQACKRMDFPDVAGFAQELQHYCQEIIPTVNKFLAPPTGSAPPAAGGSRVRRPAARQPSQLR